MIPAVYREIGLRIRKRREALGLTRRQVAGRAGIGEEELAGYELGRTCLGTMRLLRIARALRCRKGYLLGERESPRRRSPSIAASAASGAARSLWPRGCDTASRPRRPLSR
jgi:transcriptional regulator with XRE-family HTH domain